MRPYRGEVWYADLAPAVGHEQDGVRPVLVVSSDELTHVSPRLVVVVPITRTFRPHPTHVAVGPPEGGLREPSYAVCNQVRTISTLRLDRRLGRVSDATMERVAEPLRFVLGL